MAATPDPTPTWRDFLRPDGLCGPLLDLPPDRLQELREWADEFDRRGLRTAGILLALTVGMIIRRGTRAESRHLAALRRWDARFQRVRRQLARDLARLGVLMQERPELGVVGVDCADCQTPGTIATDTAWIHAGQQASALTHALATLPTDLLPAVRNPRGHLRRREEGNPERALIGPARNQLAEYGVTSDTEQDDLLRLVGLLPPIVPA